MNISACCTTEAQIYSIGSTYTVTYEEKSPGINLSPLQPKPFHWESHSREDDIISLLLGAAVGDGREIKVADRHKGLSMTA